MKSKTIFILITLFIGLIYLADYVNSVLEVDIAKQGVNNTFLGAVTYYAGALNGSDVTFVHINATEINTSKLCLSGICLPDWLVIASGVSVEYFSINSSHLTYIESKLNNTIEDKLKITYYNATFINVNVGTDNTNDITALQNYDEVTYNVSETTGSPAMDIRINFTGIIDFNQLTVRMKTTDGGKHRYKIQIWDYVLSDWEDYTNFVEVDIFKVMDLGVYDSDEHILDGLVQVRIYLDETGIPVHEVFLDWVIISDGLATFTTNEIDPLSFHRNKNIDDSGYNITSSYLNISENILVGNYKVNLSPTGDVNATKFYGNYTGTIQCDKITGSPDTDFCIDVTGNGGIINSTDIRPKMLLFNYTNTTIEGTNKGIKISFKR